MNKEKAAQSQIKQPEASVQASKFVSSEYPCLDDLNAQYQQNILKSSNQSYSGPVNLPNKDLHLQNQKYSQTIPTCLTTQGGEETNVNQPTDKFQKNQTEILIVERPVEPEILVVEERPVFYYSDDSFPHVSLGMAWLSLIVNILLPGVGTMIVACVGVPNPGFFLLNGIFQLLTAYFIIGYILAIWTSVSLIIFAA